MLGHRPGNLETEERRPPKRIAGRTAEVLQVAWAERRSLLRFIRGGLFALPSHAPPKVVPEPLIESLTRREREVLALLAQGYSAPEIATELTLAVSSVKWHIQHIYGKLGVNGKRQAVNRANELGLLRTSAVAATDAVLT